MKSKNKLAILMACFVILVNVPPIKYFSYFYSQEFTYSNYNGEFHCSECHGKGSSLEGCQRTFNTYIKNHPNTKDKAMYRLFTIKPWRFWEWYQYFTEDRFRFLLPLISNEAIEN